MEQLCQWLAIFLSQLALWVNNLWGWLLQNAGEQFPAWWLRQPHAIKILVLSGVTILLGGGTWAVGYFVFQCPDFPSWQTVLLFIVSAIAGLFIAGKRWEEAKVAQLRQENDELRAEITSLQMGG